MVWAGCAAAHPRVGGEHTISARANCWRDGSSPRGRGTRRDRSHEGVALRLIPAWAGNTTQRKPRLQRLTAHPRVGGEHQCEAVALKALGGSSPRGRGTLRALQHRAHVRRLIPAWAGNTPGSTHRTLDDAAHPRVGGEHNAGIEAEYRKRGSSPRGRGTRWQEIRDVYPERLIPAWAGNTLVTGCPSARSTAHPRVGGEHSCCAGSCSTQVGSSPRGRGTLPARHRHLRRTRLIPAWAGNTAPPWPGYQIACGSSPRGRGTRSVRSEEGRIRRLIPAWAGNTSASCAGCSRIRGSSPRGRGTLHALAIGNAEERLIPAWAGNTTMAASSSVLSYGSSPRGRGTHGRHGRGLSGSRLIPAWAGNTRSRLRCWQRRPAHPRVGGEHSSVRKISAPLFGSSPRGRGTRARCGLGE